MLNHWIISNDIDYEKEAVPIDVGFFNVTCHSKKKLAVTIFGPVKSLPI